MTHLFLWPLSHDFVTCRHFHDDTSWKSLKKKPNLEDPYLEFCHFVWPHIYTVGKIFLLAKTFQKTPKTENAQKYPKSEFLMCTQISLKETHVRTWVAIYNSRVCLKYATFYIATYVCLLKMSKNMYFEIWVVWVVMQLTHLVVTTLSSTLTLH